MASMGIPAWALTSQGQAAFCAVLWLTLLLFLVAMPLLLAMRADESIGWPWAVAFVPVWIMDCLYAALLVVGTFAVAGRDESGDAIGGAPFTSALLRAAPLLSVAYLLCAVGFQVLLVYKLDHPETAPEWLSFSVAVAPIYAILAPRVVMYTGTLALGAYRRHRPLEHQPPPTWEQLSGPAASLVGRLFIAGFVALAAVRADSDAQHPFSWWVAMAPLWALWLMLTAFWAKFGIALRMRPPSNEEERVAKLVLGVGAGFLSTVAVIVLTLLSLRVGGQADYPATTILLPVWIILGLVACCLACCSCLARIAKKDPRFAEAAAAAGAPPQPAGSANPYTEVHDEETGDGMPDASELASKRPDEMSTRELKAALAGMGVDHAHCIEKSELAELLRRSRQKAALDALS